MAPVNKTHKCGICKENVTKSSGGIQCNNCVIWFHGNCVGIPDKSMSALKDSRLTFTCTSCGKDPRSGFESYLRNDINSLNDKIDEFINKVDSEHNSIKKALSDSFENFKTEINNCLIEMKSGIIDCNKLINHVEKSTSEKMTALEDENNTLHRRLNRSDIVVSGLPAGVENLYDLIVKLGSIFNVPFRIND